MRLTPAERINEARAAVLEKNVEGAPFLHPVDSSQRDMRVEVDA